MVIGSRYFGDATSEDDDIVTGFGNWLFTNTINLLHGGHYSDAMTIYRIYPTRLYYQLGLHLDETYERFEKCISPRSALSRFFLFEQPRQGLSPLTLPALSLPGSAASGSCRSSAGVWPICLKSSGKSSHRTATQC